MPGVCLTFSRLGKAGGLLASGGEQEMDVCRAGGCSGTLPTRANNPYAAPLALCYSSCMMSENVETYLVLLRGGEH